MKQHFGYLMTIIPKRADLGKMCLFDKYSDISYFQKNMYKNPFKEMKTKVQTI